MRIFIQLRVWVGFAISMLFHLIFGWAWSMVGGMTVGLIQVKHAWLAGGIANGMSWASFVAHAFIVAPEPTQRLMTIMGALFGGIPDALIPLITIIVGVLLGAAGGALGAALHPLITLIFQRSKAKD